MSAIDFARQRRSVNDEVDIVAVQNFEPPPSPYLEANAFNDLFSRIVVERSAVSAGGKGTVVPAYDADGRKIALKRMIAPLRNRYQSPEEYEQLYKKSREQFHDEFLLLSRLSGFSQFPEAYGYGEVEGAPALLMEWIDGVSLERLMQSDVAPERRDHFSAYDVAIVGESLFRVLSVLERFGDGFVHRDLSPANIILRATSTNLGEQLRNRDLDICLIDFGSSAIATNSFNNPGTASSLRGTTPEYAPPEMLTDNLPNINNLRNSPKIDVYSACSILYELLTGDTPFRLYENTSAAPAHWKTVHEPIASVAPTKSATKLFTLLLYKGMAARQEDRPSASELYEAIGRWLKVCSIFDIDNNRDQFPEAVKLTLFLPDCNSIYASNNAHYSDDIESFNSQLAQLFDEDKAWGGDRDNTPGQTMRERLSWWASHHFSLYMSILFFLFILACTYCGFTWHEAIVHWGW